VDISRRVLVACSSRSRSSPQFVQTWQEAELLAKAGEHLTAAVETARLAAGESPFLSPMRLARMCGRQLGAALVSHQQLPMRPADPRRTLPAKCCARPLRNEKDGLCRECLGAAERIIGLA
jgi:hypothetical protein